MDNSVLKLLQHSFETLTYNIREKVYTENEKDSTLFYIVKKGEFKITKVLEFERDIKEGEYENDIVNSEKFKPGNRK